MKANPLKYLNRYDCKKNRYISRYLWSFLVLGFLIAPLDQGSAIAQDNKNILNTSNQFKVTFDPPDEDQPRNSTGGASRTISQCLSKGGENNNSYFSALLPASNQGLTAVSHPTILAYLPETSAKKAFFSWIDEDNNEHYQAIVPIEQKGGVVNYSLPETAPALEVGKSYTWAIGIMCDGRLKPDSPVIQGQIKRVELASDLKSKLDSNTSLKNAAIYANGGLWYDTVATMAQLKTAQPNNPNLNFNWEELLNSIGLKDIAQSPLKIKP